MNKHAYMHVNINMIITIYIFNQVSSYSNALPKNPLYIYVRACTYL